ncbi:MAG: hypothetical protein IKD68_00065, partial [Solobacterium sp.]|nr:hypothetical protein [Solobacterium sp.]
MKRFLILLFCLILAVLITVVLPRVFPMRTTPSYALSSYGEGKSLLEQKTTSISGESHEINMLYSSGELIGVLSDKSALNRFLREIYRSEFEADFPESEVSLG